MSAKNKKYNKIAVILGGFSSEREVSLNSGIAIATALSQKYQVLPIEITMDKKFRVLDLEALVEMGKKAKFLQEAEICEFYNKSYNKTEQKDIFINPLDQDFWTSNQIDVAFLGLHGTFGEDGGIQTILELAGIPYTGSGVLASAGAMNKQFSNIIAASSDLRIIQSVVFDMGMNKSEVLKNSWIGEHFDSGKYIFGKPLLGGSSRGNILLKTAQDFLEFNFGADYILQEYITGREFTVSIFGFTKKQLLPGVFENLTEYGIDLNPDMEVLVTDSRPSEDSRASQSTYKSLSFPIIEVISQNNFDYFEKYLSADTKEICPAQIPQELALEMENMALVAHKGLDCFGLTRSDFLVTADNQIYYLETNTIPGCTFSSLCPKAAKVAGYSFIKFLEMQLDIAVQRRAQ